MVRMISASSDAMGTSPSPASNIGPKINFILAPISSSEPASLVSPGDAGEVVVDGRRLEEVPHGVLPFVGQLAHDPEVEEGDPAVVEGPDVAGVDVAVERAVQQAGLHPHLHTAAHLELAV
ncbi:MAG: hypothetical protein GEU88_20950, partial [Solirubrobacterales bacterium]|nr:hypothetical protein [Solirubrobacterales bacterium]